MKAELLCYLVASTDSQGHHLHLGPEDTLMFPGRHLTCGLRKTQLLLSSYEYIVVMIHKFDLEYRNNQKVVTEELKKYFKDNLRLIEKEKSTMADVL